MKNLLNIYDKSEWKEADGYPSGTMIKILREEEGAKTVLLKLPEGFFMEPQTHITTEQHFVLEGEYESDGEVYGIGSYQLIPPHTDHGPFKSKNGAVILVVWDPFQKKS